MSTTLTFDSFKPIEFDKVGFHKYNLPQIKSESLAIFKDVFETNADANHRSESFPDFEKSWKPKCSIYSLDLEQKVSHLGYELSHTPSYLTIATFGLLTVALLTTLIVVPLLFTLVPGIPALLVLCAFVSLITGGFFIEKLRNRLGDNKEKADFNKNLYELQVFVEKHSASMKQLILSQIDLNNSSKGKYEQALKDLNALEAVFDKDGLSTIFNYF